MYCIVLYIGIITPPPFVQVTTLQGTVSEADVEYREHLNATVSELQQLYVLISDMKTTLNTTNR